MQTIILELLIFRYLWLMLENTFFKAIIFIQAAFIHKIKVFSNIFVREISNMALILYFSHIFILNAVLEIISRKIFKNKNKRILLFDGPFLPQT